MLRSYPPLYPDPCPFPLPQKGPTIDEIAVERLEAFKLKVQKQERLERLWTTHGSAARSKCSVWAPVVTHGNFVQRNKASKDVSLGCFGVGVLFHGFGLRSFS